MMRFKKRKADVAYWSLVPCMPHVAIGLAVGRRCASYEDVEPRKDGHSHWLNPAGVEVITYHKRGERMMPNCEVRYVE